MVLSLCFGHIPCTAAGSDSEHSKQTSITTKKRNAPTAYSFRIIEISCLCQIISLLLAVRSPQKRNIAPNKWGEAPLQSTIPFRVNAIKGRVLIKESHRWRTAASAVPQLAISLSKSESTLGLQMKILRCDSRVDGREASRRFYSSRDTFVPSSTTFLPYRYTRSV